MPNEKRARHKAYRNAKMAELRRAQKRQRLLKRSGVVAIFLVVALFLALFTSHTWPFTKAKTVATKTTTSTTTTTTPTSTTTTDVNAVKPLPLATMESYLKARKPPPISPDCHLPATGSSTTTTTIPAKGKAVATIHAPAKVGFPDLNGSSPHYTAFSSAPPFCINVKDTYTATIRTTAGTIVIELLPKYAPITVNSFVFLAGYHFYNGIIFHRVIPGFMDQGGDPTGTGDGGPGYKFDDELPTSAKAYDAGAMAMANSGANTNGSQFFLVSGNGGEELTPAYSVFGQIVSGLDVANKINAGGDAADNGTPPKITYKMLSVTITQGPPGSAPAASSTTTTTSK